MHAYALLSLALPTLAAPYGQDAHWGKPFGGPQAGRPHFGGRPSGSANAAAYFLDNNPSGSSIVSLHIGQDGMLSQPMRTSTGGTGLLEVNSTGDSVPSDGLGSQGAVKVSGDMLFTVNAGSNTLSMFMIDPREPWNIKLVGKPVSTLGEFPTAVDYSPKLKQACVLNGGAVAGVACFSVDSYHGLSADGPLRKLGKSIIDETTPPSGPPGSSAQVLFNPDSTAVFATIKGDPDASPVKLGSFLAWPVENGKISTGDPVNSQIDDVFMDFGFQFLSESTVFLSDPSFGASLLEIGSDLRATETAHTVIPSQVAICWTQYDTSLNTLYAIDAGKELVYKLSPQTGAMEGSISVQMSDGNTIDGVFDSVIKDNKMYSLAGTNGLIVIDLKEEKLVQYLNLSSFGERPFYQGMAFYAPGEWTWSPW